MTERLQKILSARGIASRRASESMIEAGRVTVNGVVVNDELDDAIDKVESILKAEKCRVDRIEEVYLDTKEEEIHELLMDEEFDNDSLSEKID